MPGRGERPPETVADYLQPSPGVRRCREFDRLDDLRDRPLTHPAISLAPAGYGWGMQETGLPDGQHARQDGALDAADDVRAVCLELPDGTRYYCPAAAFRGGTISPLPGHSWRVIPPGK